MEQGLQYNVQLALITLGGDPHGSRKRGRAKHRNGGSVFVSVGDAQKNLFLCLVAFTKVRPREVKVI
jgi:hypothetical protein